MSNPWTAFYWSDYDAKTAHLSLAEDGAYRRLLSHYYQTRKPLPANAEILLRVCRAFDDSEKAAVTSVLAEFFSLEADGYHNKRADEEIVKSAQISEKRRDAGKKGAEKTNGKCRTFDAANERQMPTQPHIEPAALKRSTQIPKEYKPNQQHEIMAANSGVNLSEAFSAFVDYHTSKGSTFKDWDAALRTWIRNDRKFITGANHAESITERINRVRKQQSAGANSSGIQDAEVERRGLGTLV